MIYRNPPLVTITLVVCGMFLSLGHCLDSGPDSDAITFQAGEGANVTIEWRFASEAAIEVSSLKIHCIQLPELKVFYNLDSSVFEAQHEQFAGRVRCDEEALTAGRVRLQLARVRTEDSAEYLCRMAKANGKMVKVFTLNITAPEESIWVTGQLEPATRGRIGICVGLGLFAAALALALLASSASFIKRHTPGYLK